MNYSKIISNNIINILRLLNNEETNNLNKTINNDVQKEQLRDLYIYIGALVIIIVLILGGYALYRKCVEKRALEEIEREYQLMIMNLLNSISSDRSSREDKRPHSCNNINPNYIQNYINEMGNQNLNNSIDFNYEERMENIRKKFGNAIVIKCLLKKQIEEIQYTKNFAEELGDICTICMENFIEHIIISKTPCEHIFHKKCFDTYLKGIQKKDKLLCPNCNQNLLINKKYLKLRAKTKMIEVKQKKSNKKDIKDIKESELNLENDFKNRNSVMTNKNEENIVSSNNNEIILIKKKSPKLKNKIGEDRNINIKNYKKKDEDNIYNPQQIRIRRNESYSKLDKDTIIPFSDQNENIDKSENEKNKKRIVFISNFDKNNSNSLKNALTNNESKAKLYSKKRKINLNVVNSEREGIMINKKTCGAINSSSKQEN